MEPYCGLKFKPSRQKKFHIEKKNNNKTRTNVKLFLVTVFEFVYTVIAFYIRTESILIRLRNFFYPNVVRIANHNWTIPSQLFLLLPGLESCQ